MLWYHCQVEYCPCVIAGECWNLMKEMTQSFLGSLVDFPPSLLKVKTDTFYTPSDTINQYLEHFNNFRKSTSVTQPNR